MHDFLSLAERTLLLQGFPNENPPGGFLYGILTCSYYIRLGIYNIHIFITHRGMFKIHFHLKILWGGV